MDIDDAFLTVNSDLNGDNPQFTLTCISTGGPVSCVVWRRAKKIVINPNATSTLLDPADGRYMHNLTVKERLGGTYTCSVANNKPTSEYEGIPVQSKLE